jgi:hypothetical protein
MKRAGAPLPAMILALSLAVLSSPGSTSEKTGGHNTGDTYNQDEVVREVSKFFGEGAAGISQVIAKAFKEQGEPNGYIMGEEAGGAVGVGVRYGKGKLQMHDGRTMPVYWQGPSVGFDVGGNAAKTFVLIYNLQDTEKLFQRYPGVEGSLYFVGGVGLHYVRSAGVTLAPVRFGVGWRQGASVGYMHFTRKKRINPF